MKMGNWEDPEQLRNDFIKDDAAGDAAIGAASPFLLFSQKVEFQGKVKKLSGSE